MANPHRIVCCATARKERDGRRLYFASKRTGEYQVWKTPAQGGEPLQVTHGGGIAPVESPDGKTLYFAKESGTGGLWKMAAAGGPETQVLPDLYRYNYAVTDKGIYFTPRNEADGNSSVQFYSFATGKTTQIVKVPKPLDLGPSVSPGGRTLLYSQIDYSGRGLMLVENFR